MKYNDLILWQYKGKPKAVAHVGVIVDLFSDAFKEVAQIPEIMDIQTATGAALDLCGKRVGQSRILTDFYPLEYFGFTETKGAKGFSKNGGEGGNWYRSGNPTKDTVRLNDEDYRFLIKCRIAKNFQMGNIDSMQQALRFIFDDAVTYDNYNMSLSVIIKNKNISDFKKYVIKQLDLLPRPAGVNIAFYLHVNRNNFGFLGGKNAQGFNTGKFARII